MKRASTAERLLSGRLIVVCGPGGVGKTTTAAALALSGSASKRKTLVCTIDPSKRLRTSLGLTKLTGTPQKVKPHLFAMRLDPKETFDDLVRRHAASPQARDRILQNRFYQQISRHLAGTHEVMAMEALMQVVDDFDLIVLDTPPASSAIAFLDAPKRVLDFVDGRVLRYFLKPYFVAGRLTIEPRTIVGRTFLKILDASVGLQFLRDLSEFFLAFEGLFDSFRQTAIRMEERLRADGTSFVLVTTPVASRVREGISFARALEERSLRSSAIIANRVHPWALEGATELRLLAARGRSGLPQDALAELRAIALLEGIRARNDSQHVRDLKEKSGVETIVVPELETDVHDLRSLAAVASWLYPEASVS